MPGQFRPTAGTDESSGEPESRSFVRGERIDSTNGSQRIASARFDRGTFHSQSLFDIPCGQPPGRAVQWLRAHPDAHDFQSKVLLQESKRPPRKRSGRHKRSIRIRLTEASFRTQWNRSPDPARLLRIVASTPRRSVAVGAVLEIAIEGIVVAGSTRLLAVRVPAISPRACRGNHFVE